MKFRKTKNCPRIIRAYVAAREAALAEGFDLRQTDFREALMGPIPKGRACPYGRGTHPMAMGECECTLD